MATYWENSCSFGLRYVSWCECLIVSLVFSHLGFWSGSLFLVAPFPDLCLLVPFYHYYHKNVATRLRIFMTTSCSTRKTHHEKLYVKCIPSHIQLYIVKPGYIGVYQCNTFFHSLVSLIMLSTPFMCVFIYVSLVN